MTYDPDFDFVGNVQRLSLAMNVLAAGSVDLDGIIETVGYVHALGPVLDPTKYRDALYRGDMDAMADVARALLPAVKVWQEKVAPKIEAVHDPAGVTAGLYSLDEKERP